MLIDAIMKPGELCVRFHKLEWWDYVCVRSLWGCGCALQYAAHIRLINVALYVFCFVLSNQNLCHVETCLNAAICSERDVHMLCMVCILCVLNIIVFSSISLAEPM